VKDYGSALSHTSVTEKKGFIVSDISLLLKSTVKDATSRGLGSGEFTDTDSGG